jgi:Fur family iron response transcriptional regulator
MTPACSVRQMLENHSILPTPQRLAVAEVLLHKPQHMSVGQILEKLKLRGNKVSKATVYNTLNTFGECGLVKEIHVDPARRFFDSATHPHHHCYNIDTGELIDIDVSQLSLRELPQLPEGTQEDSVEILIKVRNIANLMDN